MEMSEFFLKNLGIEHQEYLVDVKNVYKINGLGSALVLLRELPVTINELSEAGYSFHFVVALAELILRMDSWRNIESEDISKLEEIAESIKNEVDAHVRNTEGFYKVTDDELLKNSDVWTKHEVFRYSGELRAIIDTMKDGDSYLDMKFN